MVRKPSLQEQRKRETRQQIQKAARSLIIECGFEKTTMRALAEKAGVGLGTIALHFNDKKSLLFSTFFEEIGEVLGQAIESIPGDAPLMGQFRHMLHCLYGYYSEQTLFLRSVVKEALFATGEWKERFDAQLMEALGLIAAIVENGKATGEVKPEVSGAHVALVCWSLYLNGLIDGLNAEEFDASKQVAQVEPLFEVVLNGVLA
ncbi:MULTISPECIES: TetR/AcrR family transcriptional regulator [unclassified Pseudodesulfovibrio]|uniref:TetR/AcrR family transcriptional regulator n=1 Tax=unclassified Pseudodesulfovibrio TaxID=2661612 RepID=UPI000FEC0B46|nr:MULTISPECIES: TetR/AcrR family transcriptional regulator [unclassified Pseudodesulfovibrio]MCJ2165180.1 TetR/AcrR family transcriptional regulator [Pseudodesulfovibrio sp. S3-i]RWU03370.1 TetR/AcrR family transcriptional regulator [Pseudodesulfovibrio sp. S3]